MKAISTYKRVLVDSGHGVGKSSLMSWVGLWFLATRPTPCRVPCTAPTGHQLKDVLWPNFSRYLGTSLIKNDIEWMATEVRHKIMKPPHFALLRTSNKSENMQGQHENHMLWLVDEAYGIMDRDLWEVINGSMTEDDNKMLLAGNPTQVSGPVADIKNPRRSPEWAEPKGKIIRLSSADSPFVSKDWIASMEAKWGRHHDVYRVRVLGLPPLGNPKAFISLADVSAAVDREVEDEGEFEIGVDPAREGDDLCVLSWRRGHKFFPFDTLPKSDEVEIAAMILKRVRKIRSDYNTNRKIRVKIENIGGYGSGAIDILRRNRTDNIEIIPITSGGGGNKEYANAQTVMWAEIRDNIDKFSIPDDDDLKGQLCSREATVDVKTGRMIIEPKKIYKKRMGHSPDKADAMILCWTRQAPATTLIEIDIAKVLTKINVKWDALGPMTIPMIGLYTNKEMKTGLCVALWRQQSNVLYVILSTEFESARPERIIPDISVILQKLSNGVVKDLNRFEWFGNDIYETSGLGTVRYTWSKIGINVRANEMFSVDGAILAINRLLNRKSIIFDEAWAGHLAISLQAWQSEHKDEAPVSIMAMAELISVINEGTYLPKQQPLPAFSPEKQEAKKRNEEYLSAGRDPTTPSVGESSWMV